MFGQSSTNMTNVVLLIILTIILIWASVTIAGRTTLLRSEIKPVGENILKKVDIENDKNIKLIIGKWKMCLQNDECYIVTIENKNNKIEYSQYLTPSNIISTGIIKNVNSLANENIEVVVYNESLLKNIDRHVINLSSINQDIMLIDNYKYIKIYN